MVRPGLIAVLLLSLLLGVHSAGATSQLMYDPGFELLPAGPLASPGAEAQWEVQRTGRKTIRDRLGVACVDDQGKARSGRKCLSLSIPKDTVGFEFVTVGQRPQLAEGKPYEASVWVRWSDGPAEPPAKASSTSGHPSAILSFWARERDGKGTFAGRDEWLFDNRWHKLAFRFYPTDSRQRTLIYVSLLPNQRPRDTTVLVDDFELMVTNTQAESETRTGNVVQDSRFGAQGPGAIAPPWNFVNRGGTSISAHVVGKDRKQWVSIEMPPGRSNFESAQLWQHVDLRRGARYEVSCRIRWENFQPGSPPPIVNYGIYHEDSRTWYGPVDQVLQENGDWNVYQFAHIPPYGGTWKLYVQLNGWGNFGRAVNVAIDDLTCMATRSARPASPARPAAKHD